MVISTCSFDLVHIEPSRSVRKTGTILVVERVKDNAIISIDQSKYGNQRKFVCLTVGEAIGKFFTASER